MTLCEVHHMGVGQFGVQVWCGAARHRVLINIYEKVKPLTTSIFTFEVTL